MSVRPNFFIVGAPKAGTTSAYRYLSQHPDAFLCPVKEPNHFASASIRDQGLYYEPRVVESEAEYLALFEGGAGRSAVGEASVSYLFYGEACRRIADFAPEARIVVFLRDPVERAWSHYLMDLRLGLVTADLGDIIAAGPGGPRGGLHYQQYVELGMYAGQIERYLQAFGRERVRVALFDDLQADPLAVASGLFGFLGIDPAFRPDTGAVHNPYRRPRGRVVAALYGSRTLRTALGRLVPAAAARRIKDRLLPAGSRPELDAGTRDRLADMYREDLARTETLLGRRLPGWLDG